MDIKQITFGLENCDAITIDGKDISRLKIDNICRSIRKVGSVYVSNNYLHVSYYGSHEICQQLKNMFELKNKVYDKKSISFISFQKKESVKKFYDFIYKDATIYMRRKKEKFDKNLC